jgi:ssDNA-binding replication factor A large subunit
MNVNDLKPRSNVEKIELTVMEIEEPRGFFSREGAKGNVCSAVARDDAGERVGVTLWNNEIEKVNKNDRIIIINGWVKEWYGQLEISTGKFGSLEVIR